MCGPMSCFPDPPFSLDASDEEVLRQCRKYFSVLSQAQYNRVAADAETMTLCQATGSNRLDLMIFLIDEKGQDVNAKDAKENGSRDYPIFHCRNGKKGDLPYAARLLLAAKADPNQANGFNWTAMMMNKCDSSTEVIDVLIKGGAGVNKKTRNTALVDAAWNGATAVVRRLLEAKADLDKCGDSSWTPVQAAVASSYRNCGPERGFEITKLLLENDANLSCLSPDYVMPASKEIRELLKAYGWAEPK